MDLFIVTLTGTKFELRVNPFVSILSIKAMLQQLEGIAISQQHLIWQSVELEDDFCLHDYNIAYGSTLQLVLAMRGGPVNMRRVPIEEPTLKEIAEYMDSNMNLSFQNSSSQKSRHSVIPQTESKLANYNLSEITPSPELVETESALTKFELSSKPPLPPVNSNGKLLSKAGSCSSKDSNGIHNKVKTLKGGKAVPKKNNQLPSIIGVLPVSDISTVNHKVDSKPFKHCRRMLKPLGTVNKHEKCDYLSKLRTSPHEAKQCLPHDVPEILKDIPEQDHYKKLIRWVQPQSESFLKQKKSTAENCYGVYSPKVDVYCNLTRLPPVNDKRNPLPLVSKKKERCIICRKKLGLTNTYLCRCGKKFCSIHRYPETHTCTYDYKTEGRNLLRKNNPIIMAPKLPKI